MTQLLSPATFEFFARYLLAGYVVILVRSRFILGVRPKPAELVVEAVILSLINQLALMLLRLGASATPGIPALPDIPTQADLTFEVVVLPTLIGLALGWNLSRGWNNAVLRLLSMPVIRPVQRAYDFAFGQGRPPGLVIVTYDDGTVVRGLFGGGSLAASDPERSDIYLERLYSQDESGQWQEMSPGRSGLLSLKGVRSIEFLDPQA